MVVNTAAIIYNTSHSGSPSFSVRLNATRLTGHELSDAGPHSWHEVIPTGVLKPESNELTLAVSGNGSVTFSDIVILYQSNQLTVKQPFPGEVIART